MVFCGVKNTAPMSGELQRNKRAFFKGDIMLWKKMLGVLIISIVIAVLRVFISDKSHRNLENILIVTIVLFSVYALSFLVCKLLDKLKEIANRVNRK